jgi:hypothetical protein
LKTQPDTNTEELFLEGLGKRGWIGLAKLSHKEPFEGYKSLQYALQRRRNRRGRGGVRSESVSTADIIKAVKESRTPEFQVWMAQLAPFEEYEHEALPPVEEEDDDEATRSVEEGNGEPMATFLGQAIKNQDTAKPTWMMMKISH